MATVKYYVKELKSGEASIFGTVTITRDQRFKFFPKERIPFDQWDSKKQQVKSRYPSALGINQHLDKLKFEIIQIYRDHKTASTDELKAMVANFVEFGEITAPQKKSLFLLLDESAKGTPTKEANSFIDIYSRTKDKKTTAKYRTLSVRLKEFRPKLNIDHLDNNFYERFKQHLFDCGYIDSTVYKYLTNLCTFLTWANDHGHRVHHSNDRPSHLSWEILRRDNDPISLTRAELESLESLIITAELIEEKLPPAKHGRRGERSVEAFSIARDYLVLECRTAQRISDIKSIKESDIIWSEEAGWIWVNKVTKGERLLGKTVRIPFNTKFTQPALKILQKYNYNLPKISEQNLNENIKSVCQLAGIKTPVTVIQWKQNQKIETTKPKHDWISTHTGRKTFITIGLQFMAAKLVKDIAGISWKTLKNYEGQSEDQVLIDGLNSIPVSPLKIAQ
jgi:integrase